MPDPRPEDWVPVQEDATAQPTAEDWQQTAPSTGDIAAIRRAGIEQGKDQTGQTFGPEILPYAVKKSYAYSRGQDISPTFVRLLSATKELLSAPGPWVMETLSRPTEDTPLTVALGASLELASPFAVPIAEPFVQATQLVGESLGWDQEKIDEYKARAGQAAEIIGATFAAAPHLAAPTVLEAQKAYLESPIGRAKTQLYKSIREDKGITYEALDKALKIYQEQPEAADWLKIKEEPTSPVTPGLGDVQIRPEEAPKGTTPPVVEGSKLPPPKPVDLAPAKKVELAYEMSDEPPQEGVHFTPEQIQEIERQAIAEETPLQSAERLTEDDLIAKQLGVDRITGEPLMTPEERRAQVARKNAPEAVAGRDFTQENVIEPSRQTFKETYGGTEIGSAAAKAARADARLSKIERLRPTEPGKYQPLRNTTTGQYDVALANGKTATIYRNKINGTWLLTEDSARDLGVDLSKGGDLLAKGTQQDALKKLAELDVPRGTIPQPTVAAAITKAPSDMTLAEFSAWREPKLRELWQIGKEIEDAKDPALKNQLRIQYDNYANLIGGWTTRPEIALQRLRDVAEGKTLGAQDIQEQRLAKAQFLAQEGKIVETTTTAPKLPAAQPIGEVLPVRKTAVGEILFTGDSVESPDGKTWIVMEQTKEGKVLVSRRVDEPGPTGIPDQITKSESATFDRSQLVTALSKDKPYDPEVGLPAVRLKDGTVVMATRGTHGGAAREAREAGLGHLLNTDPGPEAAKDVGHVIGEPKRYLTLEQYAAYKAARKQAALEAHPPAAGTTPGGMIGEAVQDLLARSRKAEDGFVEFPARGPDSERLLKRLERQDKSPIGAHGLNVLEHAAPNALDSINTSAAARGASHFWVAHKLTIPIDKAIGKGGHLRVLSALRDWNIQDAKYRWITFSKQMGVLDDASIMEGADAYYRDWYNLAVDHLAADEGERSAMKGRLTRAITEKNPTEARKLMTTVFDSAANSIGEVPAESWAFVQDPEFWKGIDAAKEFFDQLKEWNQDVGGHETRIKAPGSPGIYIPLSPFSETVSMKPFSGQTWLPFRRLKPGTTMHRSGLSGQYDASVEALARRVQANVKAVGRNEAYDALVEVGVGKYLEGSERPPEFLEAVAGVKEKPMVFDVTPQRTIIQPGKKPVTVPGRRLALPASIGRELERVLKPGAMQDAEAIERIQNVVVDFFLRGLMEPAIHSQNVIASLGHATGTFYPQAMWRVFRTDLNSPEAIAQLQKLAEHGMLPNRYASVTFSKELAAQFGAHYENPLLGRLSPILYGPNGVDIRARVAAGLFFDEHFPDESAAVKSKFLDQLGHYQASTRTTFQKSVTRTAIQPFYTAVSTRMRNALEVWGLTEKQTPVGGWDLAKLRARQQITQGVVGGTMAWLAADKLVTGKWAWERDDAKLWQVPVPDAWADSKIASLFWSEDRNKKKYIGIGGLFPVGYTFLRMSGAQAAINAKLRDANFPQTTEAAAAQVLNVSLSTVVGPVLHVLFAMVPEVQPGILRYGREGTGPLTFAPKEGKPSPGLDVLERLRSGTEELAPVLNEIFDILTGKDHVPAPKGARLGKTVANMLLKQIVGGEEDIWKTREKLRLERAKAESNR